MSGNGYRIGVVGSSEPFRTVLGGELMNKGYNVVSSESPEAAMAEYTKKPVDLVLSEVRFPGKMDGFHFCTEVLKNYPDTKFVCLTEYADLKNAIEMKKCGAEDFISRPYDLVDLLTIMSYRYTIKVPGKIS